MNLEKVVKLCDALSHPLRLEILYILSEKPMNIYELSKTLKVSRPVIYAHLKKLEASNLVESEVILEGNRAKRIYKAKEFSFYIDNEKIKELFKH